MEIKSISETTTFPIKSIYFELENSKDAKYYVASLNMSVEGMSRLLSLYNKGRYLVLEIPITDKNGQIREEKVRILNDVAERIRNTILNDIPGFRAKLERIITMYQEVEQLDLSMVPYINQALTGKTKQRFMVVNDLWLYAKIIRKAMEEGPYTGAGTFDTAINAIFNDQNLISSYIREIDEWKKSHIGKR